MDEELRRAMAQRDTETVFCSLQENMLWDLLHRMTYDTFARSESIEDDDGDHENQLQRSAARRTVLDMLLSLVEMYVGVPRGMFESDTFADDDDLDQATPDSLVEAMREYLRQYRDRPDWQKEAIRAGWTPPKEG